jgi:hypothetical protein
VNCGGVAGGGGGCSWLSRAACLHHLARACAGCVFVHTKRFEQPKIILIGPLEMRLQFDPKAKQLVASCVVSSIVQRSTKFISMYSSTFFLAIAIRYTAHGALVCHRSINLVLV